MTTSTLNTSPKNSLEDFRGDFEELAAVMKASWDENASSPFLYTAEFLADCFRYPGASFSLAPTIYRGDELVAFAAGFPRRVLVGSKERNLIVSAFLTAASEHKNKGYGIVVWSELMKRAQDSGFDGVVNYCIEGEAMNRMIEGSCRRLGVPVIRAQSFSYLSRPLFRKASATPADPDPIRPELLMRASARVPRSAELSRAWTEEEASWQLGRVGAVSAHAGSDTDPAILTGYIMSVSDRRQTKCLLVEDILWGTLDQPDRQRLAQDLVDRAIAAGARLAIIPCLGYADVEAFHAIGFRPSQRTLHSYLTFWDGQMPAQPVSGCYLDVF